jgi:hypothetical protein
MLANYYFASAGYVRTNKAQTNLFCIRNSYLGPKKTVKAKDGWSKILTTKKNQSKPDVDGYPKQKKIKLSVLGHMVCSGKHTAKL